MTDKDRADLEAFFAARQALVTAIREAVLSEPPVKWLVARPWAILALSAIAAVVLAAVVGLTAVAAI